MKIRFFKHVRYQWDWELSFVSQKYQLRIARRQFAFWKNCVPVFNYIFHNNRA